MEHEDLAESVAASLARLRGRRPGPGFDPRERFGEPGRDGDRGAEHEHEHDRGHGHGHGRGSGFGPGRGLGGPPFGAGRFGPPARFRLLEVLAQAEAPLSVGELAERIGVDQPRASRLVAQGVEMDLVRREVDPDDARRTRIALTERGRAFTRGFRGERRELIGEALGALTDDEQREFARLLAKFSEAWRRR